MTSPLTLVRDQIAETWEALTPPDRTTVLYRQVTGRSNRRGATSSDRTFRFLLPVREEPVGQFGPSVTHVRWTLRAEVTLSQGGRSTTSLFDASANESNLLARSIEMTSTWPTNVIGVVQGSVEITEDPESEGDVILQFEWSVTTAETD